MLHGCLSFILTQKYFFESETFSLVPKISQQTSVTLYESTHKLTSAQWESALFQALFLSSRRKNTDQRQSIKD